MENKRVRTDQRIPLTTESTDPFWRRPGFYLGILLLVYLVLGIRLVTRYGESWDEPPRIDYSFRSLAAYRGVTTDLSDEKGPFFGMLQVLGVNVLRAIFPAWQFIHAWHFMIFLAFLLGTFFIYRLCRRWVSGWPALAATLLFSTQPLIWGHAFMNPKDLPFMVFFMGSVAMGLEMVDHFFPRAVALVAPVSLRAAAAEFVRDLRGDWAAAPRRLRKMLAFTAIPLLGLVVTYPLAAVLIRWMVSFMYAAAPTSLLGGVFVHYIERPVEQPVGWYVNRVWSIYTGTMLPVGVVLALIVGGLAFLLFPSFSGSDAGFLLHPRAWVAVRWRKGWGEIKAGLAPRAAANGLKRASQLLLDPYLWIAGCFFGFANDIRTLGPASGALVAVYLLAKGRKKAIPVLLAYVGAAALVTYLCWPYLWQSPIRNYLFSASQAADFQWDKSILFGGLIYRSKTLPPSYIPAILSIQYTETALLVIIAGAALALVYFHRLPGLRMDVLVLVAWFAAPVVAAILLHSIVYDNARQFLFVVPPLFVLGSLALQNAWVWLKQRIHWFIPLTLLLVAPAIFWNIHLHPYEYIYYNRLVGGVQGAFRSYENDYWALSYKEGIAYINQVAPLNARIYIYGPLLNYQDAARPDLKLTDQLNQYPDLRYALIMTKRNIDRNIFPGSKVVFQVTRENAILSLVKQIQPGDDPGSDRQSQSPLR